MTDAIFYAVSVGAGNAELLTLQAVRVLNECAVLCFPATDSHEGGTRHIAYDAVSGAVDVQKKETLFFPVPMTRDREKVRAAYERIAEQCVERLRAGKSVAFCAIGDVSLYSTAAKIAEMVRARGFAVEFVAGVNAFSAASCDAVLSLCDRDECVTIIPADAYFSVGKLEAALRADGTKVLMKMGRHLREILLLIDACGLRERTTLVQNASLPGDRILHGDALRAVGDDVVADAYLSVGIVRGNIK